MACVMDQKISTAHLVDMPRAVKKDRLGEFYSGNESLKNGLEYDKRYNFRKIRFDWSHVFVFTNTLPDFILLSRDHWRVMRVTPNKDLERYNIDSESTDSMEDDES